MRGALRNRILTLTLVMLAASSSILAHLSGTGGIRTDIDLPRDPGGTWTPALAGGGPVEGVAGGAQEGGYTLFAPMASNITYLLAMDGTIAHEWYAEYEPGLSVYLAEDGTLYRTAQTQVNPDFDGGGWNNCFQRFSWDSTLLWQFNYSTSQYCGHHDIELMPNGNVLLIAWENKSGAEAIAAGRDPARLVDGNLWPEHVIEVRQTGLYTGDIVWEWHVWDHLIQDFDPARDNYGVVGDHPELVDINYVWDANPDRDDWLHINSVDYNPELDQILLSVHNLHEVWVIDHSTTTQEAAGHSGGRYGRGGDMLYRWGNPQVYDAGTEADRILYNQHDATWIEPGRPGAGNIMVFNNGRYRPGPDFSSVIEFAPPVDGTGNYTRADGSPYGPGNVTWEYIASPEPTSFFSGGISGAERLANGNTLICEGDDGRLFEVTRDMEIVWSYINLVPDELHNNIFKARRYTEDYPGLEPLWSRLPLHAGWNLISLPASQSNTSIDRVLRSIDGAWDRAMTFDSDSGTWLSSVPGRPEVLNTLKDLDRKMGIWIHMKAPANLTVYGIPANFTAINLRAGWNLVGYPGQTSETVDDCLAGTGYTAVEAYDDAAPYLLSPLPGTALMEPGRAYWVRVPADTVWVVDW